MTVAVVSAWLLRLAEAVELTGLQQPELLALTLEVSLALSWVKVGFQARRGELGMQSGLLGLSGSRLAKPVSHLSLRTHPADLPRSAGQQDRTCLITPELALQICVAAHATLGNSLPRFSSFLSFESIVL